MTYSNTNDPDRDEQQVAELIRQGGARLQPPAAAREAVRLATLAEWRDVVRSRRRSVTVRWSLAAAAAVAGIAVWVAGPLVGPSAAVMAAVTRVSGPVEVRTGGLFGGFAPLKAGAALTVATEIRSRAGGRVALQIGGDSVRMDENSVIAMADLHRIALESGAVYIDSGPEGGAASSLAVDTELGTVRHLGTQYETRVADGAVRVRVREGRVQLAHGNRTLEGGSGEQITLLATGDIRREPVERTGGSWAWVGEIAPAYVIEDRPLTDFLRWVSRETGRELAFASPSAEAEARRVVLRGSVDGLTPEQALAAVLATTDLALSDGSGSLRIDFKTGDR